MEAKEMSIVDKEFNRLGFYKTNDEKDWFSYDAYDTESGWLRTVIFDLKNKKVEIHRVNIYSNTETKYTKHAHLDSAIFQKKRELGWFE